MQSLDCTGGAVQSVARQPHLTIVFLRYGRAIFLKGQNSSRQDHTHSRLNDNELHKLNAIVCTKLSNYTALICMKGELKWVIKSENI